MRKWCNIYTLEMVDAEGKSSKKLHPLLSYFSYVFPLELPGLPPIQEFDFSISLKLGT